MSINKRVFGTPIKGIVRDRLEARQGVTDNLEPGQSLQDKKIAVSNYDYANRLPFVRMWTSVKIIETADIDVIEEIGTQDEIDAAKAALAQAESIFEAARNT